MKFFVCSLSLLVLFGVATAQRCSSTRVGHNDAINHFEAGKSAHAFESDWAAQDRAVQEFKCAIELRNGVYPEAWLQLSEVYAHMLRLPLALNALYRYAAQAGELDADVVNIEIPRLTRVIAAQREIESGLDRSAAPYLELSKLLWDCDRIDKALEYTESALAKYPDSVDAALELYVIGRSSKERLNEVITHALTVGSSRADIHVTAGYFYLQTMNNPRDGIKEFRIALSLDSEDAYAWKGLGTALQYLPPDQIPRKEAADALRNFLKYCKTPTQYDSDMAHGAIRRLEEDQ